jgi:hypothetical protein
MTSELKTVLQDLHKKAFSLGRAAPEDLVVFDVKREEPIADVTMKRGFKRALIGIENDADAACAGPAGSEALALPVRGSVARVAGREAGRPSPPGAFPPRDLP